MLTTSGRTRGTATALFFAPVIGLLAAPNGAPAQKEKPKDAYDLTGRWRLVQAELGNNIAGAEALKNTTFVVKGDKYTINGSVNCEGTFTIDRSQTPHHITIAEAQAIEVGEQPKYGKPVKYHGIVRLTGDKLEMRFTAVDKARPTDFQSNTEDSTYYAATRVPK